MSITSLQRKEYKRRAHHLKPVVLIGQHGLTEAVMKEIAVALQAHELIKVKIAGEDRDERKAVESQICQESGAELIQSIGKTLTIYKKREDA